MLFKPSEIPLQNEATLPLKPIIASVICFIAVVHSSSLKMILIFNLYKRHVPQYDLPVPATDAAISFALFLEYPIAIISLTKRFFVMANTP